MRKRDMVFASVCVWQACSNKISPISNPDLNFQKKHSASNRCSGWTATTWQTPQPSPPPTRTPLSTQISRQILFQVPLRLEKEIKFWAHFLTLGFFFLLLGRFLFHYFCVKYCSNNSGVKCSNVIVKKWQQQIWFTLSLELKRSTRKIIYECFPAESLSFRAH